jgi:hypothetical protein
MSRSDEIAKIVGYDSISAFLAMFRRFASEPDLVIPGDLLDAVNVVERLTAEVERLTDKIEDLKEEIRNHQEM